MKYAAQVVKFLLMRSRLTTTSRSLKCSCMSQGKSVFVIAKKRNEVSVLPSIEPTRPAKRNNGMIHTWMPLIANMKRTKVAAHSSIADRCGNIRVTVSTLLMNKVWKRT